MRSAILCSLFVLFHAALATAQGRQVTPGDYGPGYAEPGFHEKGDYFKAGFDAVVNRYGGNLVVSAKDVAIPSIGGFSLSFSRTWNSHRVSLLQQVAVAQADSPLGMGWIGHYGLLWATAPGQSRPEWVDRSGARHIFYPHALLSSVIPIPSSSPPANSVWISTSLEILVRNSATSYTLFTPDGLRYDLTQPANTNYGFFVPTQITDAHGNTWTITYRQNVVAYFEHPLVEQVRDGLGRRLEFAYGTPSGSLGRQRLISVSLNGTVLSTYQYRDDPQHTWTFLFRHITAESRVTEYETDTAALPAFGTIRRITAPSLGRSEFDYRLIPLYYEVGNPRSTYAVETVRRDGHTWAYRYLNAGGMMPVNNEFTVEERIDGTLYGTYVYYTHGLPTLCDPNLYRIGTLIRSTETWQNTTRTTTMSFQPFDVSRAALVGSCPAITVAVPRPISSTVTQDGTTLTTTYSNHDSLNFARRIVSPGSVQRDLAFHHVATGGATPRYVLGQMGSEETRQANSLVSRMVRQFNAGAVLPHRVQFFRDDTRSVDLNLDYHTANGTAGALRSKAYASSSYIERYTYQNGVLQRVDYPAGPDLSRTVNTDGTIGREDRGGVTSIFSWDRESRLTRIEAGGDAPVSVVYQTAPPRATLTRGSSTTLLVYDDSGRLTERRETIDGAVEAVESWGAFDAFDRPATQTVRAGAQYTMAYDVYGRPTSRTTAGDSHVYTYATTATGVTTTDVKNATVTRVRRDDFLGRVLSGSTNGHTVTYSYGAAVGISSAQGRQTSSPQGQGQHEITRDFLGNRTSETHPEMGTRTYDYSPEGWLTAVTTPVGRYDYTLDPLGRIDRIRFGGVDIVDRDYDATFNQLARVAYKGVTITRSGFDAYGRPTQIQMTVPRALETPRPLHPYPWDTVGTVGNRTCIGTTCTPNPSYDANYRWVAVPGAVSYDLEISSPGGDARDEAQCGSAAITRLSVSGTSSPFAALAEDSAHCYRVRARGVDGEIGPFSRWVSFKIGRETIGPCNVSITSSHPGQLGTTAANVIDGNTSSGLQTAHQDWQYVELAFSCEVDFRGLRRYFARNNGDTTGTRIMQGESLSYATEADGATFSSIPNYFSGWEQAVAYTDRAWHSVPYGWSPWLRPRNPLRIKKLRFSWDGDYDSLREIGLDYTIAGPNPAPRTCQWNPGGCSYPVEAWIPTTPTVTFTVNLRYDNFGRVSAVQYPEMDTSWRAVTKPGRWATYTGASGTAGRQKRLSYESLVQTNGTWQPVPVAVVSDTTYARTGAAARLTLPMLQNQTLAASNDTLTVDNTFDTLGRAQSMLIRRNGGNVYTAQNFVYNSSGQLQSFDRADPGLTAQVRYDYDTRGLLTQFRVGGASVTYSYDPAGNLTGHGSLLVNGLALPNDPGQPVRTTSLTLDAVGGVTYDASNRTVGDRYDGAGRLTQDGRWTYAYNEIDQISSITAPSRPNSPEAQYLYDGDGQRVREVTGSRVVYSMRGLQGELLSQETHESDPYFLRYPTKVDLLYHDRQSIATIRYVGPELARIELELRDRLGSPVVAFRGSASAPALSTPLYYEYAPYGEQIRGEQFPRQTLREFTGHERDEVSGNDYFLARYYNPSRARFNRPDPAVDQDPLSPVSFNLYAYARGNPISMTDPTGCSTEVEPFWTVSGGTKVADHLEGTAKADSSGTAKAGIGLKRKLGEAEIQDKNDKTVGKGPIEVGYSDGKVSLEAGPSIGIGEEGPVQASAGFRVGAAVGGKSSPKGVQLVAETYLKASLGVKMGKAIEVKVDVKVGVRSGGNMGPLDIGAMLDQLNQDLGFSRPRPYVPGLPGPVMNELQGLVTEIREVKSLSAKF